MAQSANETVEGTISNYVMRKKYGIVLLLDIGFPEALEHYKAYALKDMDIHYIAKTQNSDRKIYRCSIDGSRIHFCLHKRRGVPHAPIGMPQMGRIGHRTMEVGNS